MANEDAINYWISVDVQKNSGLKKMRRYFIVWYKGTETFGILGRLLPVKWFPRVSSTLCKHNSQLHFLSESVSWQNALTGPSKDPGDLHADVKEEFMRALLRGQLNSKVRAQASRTDWLRRGDFRAKPSLRCSFVAAQLCYRPNWCLQYINIFGSLHNIVLNEFYW